MNEDMVGRVCVVTGANSGIGKATAQALAALGATVVMVCRDKARAEAARSDITRASNNPCVELLLADLSVQANVRQLAAEIRKRHPQVHVLVNNAGLQRPQRTLSADGIELTLAVNHLAPFLLTNLLRDALQAGAPSRVVTVSSMVHKWAKLDLDDLQLAHGYTMDRAYYQSKLCNVLFTRELARRLDGTHITANSVEPGLVKTEFGRVYGGAQGWFVRNVWMRLFAQTPERGAQTSVYVATSPEVEGISGEHFAHCKRVVASATATDAALAQRLWAVSAGMVAL